MKTIVEFFDSDEKEYWLEQIGKSDWGAGKYLYDLLSKNELKSLCGEKTKVLLLTKGKELLSFCTYAETDDIRDTELTPWVGFVYTFPKHRGNRYFGQLLEYMEGLAGTEGAEYLYISTGEIGLYEKYGCEFWQMMKDVGGEDSRIYRKKVNDADIREKQGMVLEEGTKVAPEPKPEESEEKEQNNLALGLSLGLCLGVCYGICFDNLALGIPLGMMFGISLGSIFKAKKQDTSGEDKKEGKKENKKEN